jgi:Nuclease-related domain
MAIDPEPAPTPEWRVKFDGLCSLCATTLVAGSPAVWDRATQKMRCIQFPAPVIDAGVAGRSARLKHEQLRARRTDEVKARWGDRVGGWIDRFSDEPGSIRAWATGADGEEQLGSILASIPNVRLLNDRRVRGKSSNIDHIVVASAGIFVVDAKKYKGEVRIRRRGSFFRPVDRLYVGSWDRTKDADGMVGQVAVVESVLRTIQDVRVPTATPVLCFIGGRWPWLGAANSFNGVLSRV